MSATQSPAADAKTSQLLKTFVAEFVEITPGKGKFPKSFQMGSEKGAASEKPVREVKMTSSFAIAKYEVPQNLYEAVMGQNPSEWKGPRNSAEMFTFTEAESFCKRITLLLHEAKLIKPSELIRLPTEAEWEYSCRAGTTTAYSFGEKARLATDKEDTASILDKFGWHKGNAKGNDPPVGALKPNPWGLYDMHGYLREFVAGEWRDGYSKQPSSGTSSTNDGDQKKKRIVRGGSWGDRFEQLTSTARESYLPNKRDAATGMRCVKASKKKKKDSK